MNPFSWFRRKKKKKEKKLTIFGEEIEKEGEGSSIGIRESLSQSFSFLRPRRKIRLRFLLRFKRILAGCLFLMYLLASFMLLPELTSLLFFGTAFILLDYLWKTRGIQWVKPDD